VNRKMAAIPTIVKDPHQVRLTTPFFAAEADATGGGATLHRYQETDFIPRFLNQLMGGRITDPAAAEWWQEDRFSDHDDRLVLRLPIHRTFYLVACEVVCDRPGAPALDPQRIRSAGFVIRRTGGAAAAAQESARELAKEAAKESKGFGLGFFGGGSFGRRAPAIGGPGGTDLKATGGPVRNLALLDPATERTWLLEEGEPVGWTPAVAGGRDPDLGRRPCLNGVLRRTLLPPAYSGEETHPLHALTVRDAADKLHTILYGFLPLGGQSLSRSADDLFDGDSESAMLEADRAKIPWPFGLLGRTSSVWRDFDARQVSAGIPTPAFFTLLEVLVNRYRLGEGGDREQGPRKDPLNEALELEASNLTFVDESSPFKAIGGPRKGTPKGIGGPDGTFGNAAAAQGGLAIAYAGRYSLLDYLRSCFAAGDDNPLLPWLSAERASIDEAGGLDQADQITALPKRPEDGVGTMGLTLLLEEADAEEWRVLLGQRLLGQARRTGAELPIPKFRQGLGDLYQVLPFVRAVDDEDRERVVWAGAETRSVPFRVAAPFDPDASRPSLIQMPGLRDLKRGLAKGAAMLVPPDTRKLMDALKLNEGLSQKLVEEPPSEDQPLGMQWICSFSIPVVTIVAMILLMIMVTILNMIFFWIPWVRICLPFPKVK
jgi:hypothetical protein